MDRKLAEYRAKKKQEEFIQTTKEKLLSIFRRKNTSKMKEESVVSVEEEKSEPDEDNASNHSDETTNSVEEAPCCDELTYSKFSLYASLWLILFSLAIYMEFGAVYFGISGLYIIWANTRVGPKKRGEVSAYSVFNPGCEAIDGTLKPEQFEREIRYGAL